MGNGFVIGEGCKQLGIEGVVWHSFKHCGPQSLENDGDVPNILPCTFDNTSPQEW